LAYSAAILQEKAAPLRQYMRESGYELARQQDSAASERFQRDVLELLAELAAILDDMEDFPHHA
jgi:hypothetical protein